jgi:hypothetical protein
MKSFTITVLGNTEVTDMDGLTITADVAHVLRALLKQAMLEGLAVRTHDDDTKEKVANPLSVTQDPNGGPG